MATRPSQNPQLRKQALNSVSMVLSRQRAYTPALQLGTLNDVGGRLHLSPHLRLPPSPTFYIDIQPREPQVVNCAPMRTISGVANVKSAETMERHGLSEFPTG